jgi:hypothetical protein
MPRAAVKERPSKTEAQPQVAECQHHWYIETPAGSTSRGVCRRCGEERDFRNSSIDYVWDNDGSGSGSPWRGSRPGKSTADDPDQISASAGIRSGGTAVLS